MSSRNLPSIPETTSSDRVISVIASSSWFRASWSLSAAKERVPTAINLDEDPVAVYNYKEGDYFGEIALVRNIPRQASVKALTYTKIVSIERSAFKRVLGPIEDILKRNEDRYKKFWSCPIETN